MISLTKKNAQGQISEVDIFATDGKTLTEVDKYANGLLQVATHYATDGQTVTSTTAYSYAGTKLTKATTTSASGTIQSVTLFSADGKTVTEVDNYSYDNNGRLSAVAQCDAQGNLLKTITYTYSGNQVSGHSVSTPVALLETAVYTYDAQGRRTKVVHSDLNGTVFQTDSYAYRGNTLVQVTKTNAAGKLVEVDQYGFDGKTVTEIDTYSYSPSGVLSKVMQSNGQGLAARQIQYAADGKTITEIDLYGYDSSAKLAEVLKANGQGQVIEEDDYLAGVLSQVKSFDARGRLATLSQYAADGVTLTSVLSNAYNTAGQLATTTLKNASGIVQEVDQFTYDVYGNLTREVRVDGSGKVIETDQFISLSSRFNFGYQTENRYDANGKLFEVDQLYRNQVLAAQLLDDNGKVTEAKYFDGNGGLQEDDVYASGVLSTVSLFQQGQLNRVAHYSGDGRTVTEIDQFSQNALSVQDIYANGRLQTENKFAADGTTVTETDSYTYTTAGQVNQVVKSTSGNRFETDQYVYNARGQLTEVDKTNAAGVTTEIDYYSNGGVGRVVKPAPTPNPVTPTPAQPGPATHSWSSTSGWGEANVMNALNLVTGKNYPAVTAPAGTASYLGLMNFQSAWANGFTGQGVVIADIDTGVDLGNTALTKNLSQYDWNFITNTDNVQDDNGHGTCTAGELIASPSTNGVEGGAYGAQLMVLKALDAAGSGSDTNIAAAIRYAVDHGANVINMSLGTTSVDPLLQSAVQYASDHGTIVCMAAGNNAGASPEYPASYAQTITDAIAVGATQQSAGTYSMASFSNQAGNATAYNYVDALGVNLAGYGLNGSIHSWSGTSMATPLIAAEAADLLSANNSLHLGLSAAQIVQDIMQSASSLGSTTQASSTAVTSTTAAAAQGVHQLIQAMGSFSVPSAAGSSAFNSGSTNMGNSGLSLAMSAHG
jgi:subtilisin